MHVNETTVRVLYAHTDKAGVVYYANYLDFFEIGRTEYFRSLGKSYSDLEKVGFFLTVVEASLKYFAPAEYDDLLKIQTRLTQVRRTRLDFEYDIIGREGTKICSGKTVLACISAAARKPCQIPQELLALLEHIK